MPRPRKAPEAVKSNTESAVGAEAPEAVKSAPGKLLFVLVGSAGLIVDGKHLHFPEGSEFEAGKDDALILALIRSGATLKCE